MVAITIHLPHEAVERAKAIAESAGRSLDDVVQEIAVEGIEGKSRVFDEIKRGLVDIEAGCVVDVTHVNARIGEVLRGLR